MKISGNTILITGGGSGIGFALASQLVKDNTVIIVGRNPQKLVQASKLLNNCPFIVCDLTNNEQVIVATAVIHAMQKDQITKHIGITKVVKLMSRWLPAVAQAVVNNSTKS